MIFPDWSGVSSQNNTSNLPLFTEWAVDWKEGGLALRNGNPYTVTGNEALKIWIHCALHPDSQRFLYSAHSADYGNQLKSLIGESKDSGVLENQLRREIKETLLVCPYITAVDGFSCVRQNSRLKISFTVHSVYENFDEEVQLS